MPSYEPAPEAEALGRELIAKFHPHLSGVRVDFVTRFPPETRAGEEVWGKARKVTGLNAFLAGADPVEGFFVIEVSSDRWRILDDAAKRALVDHELTHCGVDYDHTGKSRLHLWIAPHDVEEFAEVVERHGLWRHDVKAFIESAQGRLKLVSGGD